jgi:hypothetical protein
MEGTAVNFTDLASSLFSKSRDTATATAVKYAVKFDIKRKFEKL